MAGKELPSQFCQNPPFFHGEYFANELRVSSHVLIGSVGFRRSSISRAVGFKLLKLLWKEYPWTDKKETFILG
jgi:hypothetical protein